MNRKEAFETLGIAQNANEEEIKKAYRRASSKAHPDKGGSNEQMAKVNEAYEILTKNNFTNDHDIHFDHETFSQFYRQYSRPVHEADLSPKAFAEAPPIIKERMINLTKGENLLYEYPVSFLQAYKGGEQEATINNTKVKFTIPEGVEQGQYIIIKNAGGKRSQPYSHDGDLILAIRIKPHKLFQRDYLDIFLNIYVTLETALFGGNIEIPTIDSVVNVKIPKGVNHGQIIRLKGKGFKNNYGVGNQNCIVHINLPEVNEEETELKEKLKSLKYEKVDEMNNVFKDYIKSIS